MANLSENAKTVLNYLKENEGTNVTKADIAEATGIAKASINGIVTLGLVKKGLATSTDATIEVEATDKEGNTVTKTETVKFIAITEDGKNYQDAE